MVQAFEIVGAGHEKPAMQKLILDIKADIEGGTTLHEALAKHPLYFDDLFVNLVQAGEQAGALETLLDKVAAYKEKSEAIKKKVKKALFYPAAVLVVAVIVTVILLIFVIPESKVCIRDSERIFLPLPKWSSIFPSLCSIAASTLRSLSALASGPSPISTSVRAQCVNSWTAYP